MNKSIRITANNITVLKPNEIFVFGSNLTGRHGKGAAKAAVDQFGAVYGRGIGIQGNSYAIPTKYEDKYKKLKILSIENIKPYVDDFILFAKEHKDLIFYITEIGCGLAGYKPNQIAFLFSECLDMENVYIPYNFYLYIIENKL